MDIKNGRNLLPNVYFNFYARLLDRVFCRNDINGNIKKPIKEIDESRSRNKKKWAYNVRWRTDWNTWTME